VNPPPACAAQLSDSGHRPVRVVRPRRGRQLCSGRCRQGAPIDGAYHAANWRGLCTARSAKAGRSRPRTPRWSPFGSSTAFSMSSMVPRVKRRAHALFAILTAIVVVGTLLWVRHRTNEHGKAGSMGAVCNPRYEVCLGHPVHSFCLQLARTQRRLLIERKKQRLLCFPRAGAVGRPGR
jgi:hypothetical protein